MNILAVGANPDDVEFLCAGTLAVYAKRGDSISISYLTTGDKGSTKVSQEEMIAIRQKETANAAEIIGAGVYPLEIPDGEVEVTLELRKRIVEIIRKTKPDIIITHYPDDYMSDHNCTSQLVTDAAFWSRVPNYDGIPNDSPKHEICPSVYYMDTLGGINFLPEEYVDISDVIDTKIEMLSQHKSQIKFMKESNGMDFVDYMRTAAKYRGYQCGVDYAEGFIAARRYPMITPKRLLP